MIKRIVTVATLTSQLLNITADNVEPILNRLCEVDHDCLIPSSSVNNNNTSNLNLENEDKTNEHTTSSSQKNNHESTNANTSSSSRNTSIYSSFCNQKTKKCECSKGYSGNNCHLKQPIVKCLPDRIEIHINKQWAQTNANVVSADQLYLGSHNQKNEKCYSFPHPEDQDNTFILQVLESNDCGTSITRDNKTMDYIYSNQVLSNAFSADTTNPESENNLLNTLNISRIPTLNLLNWECRYKSQYKVSYSNQKESNAKDKNTATPIKIIDQTTLPNNNQIKLSSFSDKNYKKKSLSSIYDGDWLYLEILNLNKKHQTSEFDISQCSINLISDNVKTDIRLDQIFGAKNCPEDREYQYTEVIQNSDSDLKLKYEINRDILMSKIAEKIETLSNKELKNYNLHQDPEFYIQCQVTELNQDSNCDSKIIKESNNVNSVRNRRSNPVDTNESAKDQSTNQDDKNIKKSSSNNSDNITDTSKRKHNSSNNNQSSISNLDDTIETSNLSDSDNLQNTKNLNLDNNDTSSSSSSNSNQIITQTTKTETAKHDLKIHNNNKKQNQVKNSDMNTNNNNHAAQNEINAQYNIEPKRSYIIENGPFILRRKLLNSMQDHTNTLLKQNSETTTSSTEGESLKNQVSSTNLQDENDDFYNNQQIISSNEDINTENIIELMSLLNKVKDNVNKADAVQLESVLDHLEKATNYIKPLIELTSEYNLLSEYDMPGPLALQLNDDNTYIKINDVSKDLKEEQIKKKVQTMIILSICLGMIFICLVAIPVLFIIYRNYISNITKNKLANQSNPDSGSNNNSDPNSKSFDHHQIITIDTGLNVDHALHFVEYTDHIHDLVFEDVDSENGGHNSTGMWVKQISTDTQSIDISNQDPINMKYTNSIYNKNPHNPQSLKQNPCFNHNIKNLMNKTKSISNLPVSPSCNSTSNIICNQDVRRTYSNSSNNSSINSFQGKNNSTDSSRAELPIPSYVNMTNGNSLKDNMKRKKSFRLAGVKIPTEIINTILTHESHNTSKPYKQHIAPNN